MKTWHSQISKENKYQKPLSLNLGTSLAVQCLKLHAPTSTAGAGSIPGRQWKSLMLHGVAPNKHPPPHLYLVVPSFVEWSVTETSFWKVWESCFKVCAGSTISSVGKLERFHLEASWTWEKRYSRTNLFLLLININCNSCWGLQMGLAFQISLWAEPLLKIWSSSEGSGFFFF